MHCERVHAPTGIELKAHAACPVARCGDDDLGRLTIQLFDATQGAIAGRARPTETKALRSYGARVPYSHFVDTTIPD
jgi:hypothetical protein